MAVPLHVSQALTQLLLSDQSTTDSLGPFGVPFFNASTIGNLVQLTYAAGGRYGYHSRN
jgi:hypothetical protein